MPQKNLKINLNNNCKLYATTFYFQGNRASLTFFTNAKDFVTANMLAIQRYISEYCNGDENILLAKTDIKKVVSHSTRSKKHSIKKTKTQTQIKTN